MILPTKYIKFSNSLISVGATLLKYIDNKHTVTALWNITRQLPEVRTFERFTLGLDLLFIIGAIDFNNGLLERVKDDSFNKK